MPANFVRLPLKNANNLRDLGGYACDGGVTRWKTFIRGDSLSALDAGDVRFLLDYGVKTILDLRAANEIAAAPEPPPLIERTSYHHIPLVSGDVGDATKLADAPPNFISDFYLSVVKQEQSALKAVLNAAASARGALLFHCSAGKDRTGIIAAMLLGIAGVSAPDIIANYEVTYTYIRNNPDMIRYAKAAPQALDLLYSRREYLEGMLDYITAEYGGIPEYLSAIGLPPDSIQGIRKKFIKGT
jgi:protein-tyrosine phosphatase